MTTVKINKLIDIEEILKNHTHNDIKKVIVNIDVDSKELEELLFILAKYGKPRISLMENGWFAGIIMDINVLGSDLNIKSETNNETPKKAIVQLIERLNSTIDTVTKIVRI